MSECVDLVAKAGKEVVPVFISIDPERDTVKRVKVRHGTSSLTPPPSSCACDASVPVVFIFFHTLLTTRTLYIVETTLFHKIFFCSFRRRK